MEQNTAKQFSIARQDDIVRYARYIGQIFKEITVAL